jgi:hypothetical protein
MEETQNHHPGSMDPLPGTPENQPSQEDKIRELWEAWKKEGNAGLMKVLAKRDEEFYAKRLNRPNSEEMLPGTPAKEQTAKQQTSPPPE